MSLEMLENGKRGVVTRIDGGGSAREHLLALGLVPGVPVRKLQGGLSGPVLVEVLGTQVMVGHGLAMKVVLS